MLVVIATGAASGIASASVADPAASPSSCRIRTETAENEDWIASDVGQRVNEAVTRELALRYGVASKSDPIAPLRSRLVGATVDHASQSIVVVVDPTLPGRDGLGRDLSNVADRARGAAALSGPAVRVQAACFSTAELIEADRVLSARSWHPDAVRAPIGAYLDPADSRFHVTVDTRYPDVAAALRTTLGELVVVALGSPSRLDRNNDGSPHYGGAFVGNGSQNFCTAGFSIIRNDGYRGSVTAGHCFNNNDLAYSGSRYYGIGAGEANYPTYDMIQLTSSSETYSNHIYVDPCCPSVRTVTGRGNPSANTFVCVSGAYTGARCSLRVIDWNGRICDQDGCTYGLITARRDNGTVVVQHGDSGAPLYSKPDSVSATIRGLFIGSPDGGVTAMSELISHVESHLGVTVMTS
ncbi:MAG TPA: S1 family peptidase [Acidimicrobiales bacterium]